MTLKTVAIGAALVLAGVLLGMNFPIAEAQQDGPYALTAAGNSSTAVWRMNQRTGQVSLCFFVGSVDDFKAKTPTPRQTARSILCSPWGPADAR